MATIASPRRDHPPNRNNKAEVRMSRVSFPTAAQVTVPLYKVTRAEPIIEPNAKPSAEEWKKTIVGTFHKQRLLLHRAEVQASILEFLAVNQPLPPELGPAHIRLIVTGLVALCAGTRVTAPHSFMLLSSFFETDDRVTKCLIRLITSGKMDLSKARLPYFIQYTSDSRVQACAIRFAELLMGHGVVGTDIVESLEVLYAAEKDRDDNISLSSYTSLDRLDETVPVNALSSPLACASEGEVGCILDGDIELDHDYPAGNYKLRVQTFSTQKPSGCVVKVWYTGHADDPDLSDTDSDEDARVLTSNMRKLNAKRKHKQAIQGILPRSSYKYIQHTEIAFVLKQDMARVSFTIRTNGKSNVCVTALDVQRTSDLSKTEDWLGTLETDMEAARAQVGTFADQQKQMQAADSAYPGDASLDNSRAGSRPGTAPISPRQQHLLDAGSVPSVSRELGRPSMDSEGDEPLSPARRILSDDEATAKIELKARLREANEERLAILDKVADPALTNRKWKIVLAMILAGDVASLGLAKLKMAAAHALNRPLFKVEHRRLQQEFDSRVFRRFLGTKDFAAEIVEQVKDGIVNAGDDAFDSDSEDDEESFINAMLHRVRLSDAVRPQSSNSSTSSTSGAKGDGEGRRGSSRLSLLQPTSPQDPHGPQAAAQITGPSYAKDDS